MNDPDFYFAFGANMSERGALRRRKIVPLSREVARLPGHRLVFDAAAVPLVEPAFASVIAHEGHEVWGVLYELAHEDMLRLDRYEGSTYRTIEVTVVGQRSGPRPAIAYQSKRPVPNLVPSRRYRDALVAGAKEQGLPASYVAELEAIPATYVPVVAEVARGMFRTMEALHRRGLSITNVMDWARRFGSGG